MLGFYTAQVMGLPFEDVHEAVFNAIPRRTQAYPQSLTTWPISMSAYSDVKRRPSFVEYGAVVLRSIHNVRKNQSDLVRFFGVRSDADRDCSGGNGE